jgi:hypothetical protein
MCTDVAQEIIETLLVPHMLPKVAAVDTNYKNELCVISKADRSGSSW